MYTKEYLEKIRNNFPINYITEELNKLKSLKLLVIGDTILDEYVYTLPKGRAIKDPILSLDFVRSECYMGGILAIAKHIARFVDKVDTVSLLGEYNRHEEIIKNSISKNINAKFFTKKNSPTTIKKRYIDNIRKGKLFKVEYINDSPVGSETEKEIIDYLKLELPKYDVVVLGDFGHGFITPAIIRVLEENSKFLAANIQTNSSNMGFNYITKISKADYITTNEQEIRLAMSDRFGDLNEILKKLKEKTRFNNILLTQGGSGCMLITDNGIYSGPSLTGTIKDVVGAGDAVFAITSLLLYNKTDGDLFAFIANCVGGIAVNIMGNEKSISKEELIKFIEDLK